MVEQEGKAPFAEKLAMKGYAFAASSPTVYGVGTKSAPSVMSPFTKNGFITDGPGPVKLWTDIRDLPELSKGKDKFRTWFDNRDKGGN